MKDDIKTPTKEQVEAQKKFNKLQVEEMLGEANMYFTFLALKRAPTPQEAAMHFARFGGAEEFRKKYGHLVCLLPESDNS